MRRVLRDGGRRGDHHAERRRLPGAPVRLALAVGDRRSPRACSAARRCAGCWPRRGSPSSARRPGAASPPGTAPAWLKRPADRAGEALGTSATSMISPGAEAVGRAPCAASGRTAARLYVDDTVEVRAQQQRIEAADRSHGCGRCGAVPAAAS
ncbi:MAG: hypothetical protein MZV64_25895 [Ignavibacteriales bacterium]|nr:hypothetical protein [Ignavibacteriales bacterium]